MSKLISLVFIALISINAQATETISTEKKGLIDVLLDQTGQSSIAAGKQLAEAFIQQMLTTLKQSNPDINPQAFVIIEEEVKAIIKEELIVKKGLRNMMYPIYSNHFSMQDLKDMIAFNKTAQGQKIIKVMPAITQEGMKAGQTFGQSLTPKVLERISTRFKAEGITQ